MIDLEMVAESASRIRRLQVSSLNPDHSMTELSKILERIAWAQEEIQRDLVWIKRKLSDEI